MVQIREHTVLVQIYDELVLSTFFWITVSSFVQDLFSLNLFMLSLFDY